MVEGGMRILRKENAEGAMDAKVTPRQSWWTLRVRGGHRVVLWPRGTQWCAGDDSVAPSAFGDYFGDSQGRVTREVA